VALVTHPI